MDDACEAHERRVRRESFVHELLERAAAPLVRVRVARARSIEADSAEVALNLFDLVGLDEEDHGVGVEEPADEPAGGRSIDVDPFSRHPGHETTSSVPDRVGRNAAAQSVPATPSIAATANVNDGRTVQSAPPIAAAPGTAKPRIP